MQSILIADDHPLLRAGIKQVIAKTFDLDVIDEVATGYEVLDKVWHNDYDLVILDIGMPGRSGLEVLKQLKEQQYTAPVLILSVHPEKHFAIRALKAGAAGYLTKESASDELVTAIRVVMNGEQYISSSLAKALASFIAQGATESPHEILTDREFEIFSLIASGVRLIDIAKQLSLSAKTVSAHRANILRKMKMTSNAELTHYATEKGFLDQ